MILVVEPVVKRKKRKRVSHQLFGIHLKLFNSQWRSYGGQPPPWLPNCCEGAYRTPQGPGWDAEWSVGIFLAGLCCLPPVFLYNLLFCHSRSTTARIVARLSQMVPPPPPEGMGHRGSERRGIGMETVLPFPATKDFFPL